MHPDLNLFIHQYLGVVCATLMAVVLTTFLTIPFNLGIYPGEIRSASTIVGQHMT